MGRREFESGKTFLLASLRSRLVSLAVRSWRRSLHSRLPSLGCAGCDLLTRIRLGSIFHAPPRRLAALAVVSSREKWAGANSNRGYGHPKAEGYQATPPARDRIHDQERVNPSVSAWFRSEPTARWRSTAPGGDDSRD